jgi:hypothetical protein
MPANHERLRHKEDTPPMAAGCRTTIAFFTEAFLAKRFSIFDCVLPGAFDPSLE